jgi:hypothetical protein
VHDWVDIGKADGFLNPIYLDFFEDESHREE